MYIINCIYHTSKRNETHSPTTACVCFRNDFDWSEVSLSPGDGWGEYVEEYESSLCVSLDIDHGYRWDTR